MSNIYVALYIHDSLLLLSAALGGSCITVPFLQMKKLRF